MALPRSFRFLRHGETGWNREGRLQGFTDIPLNETGRAQARAAIALLEPLKIDRIVASPLSRALETAEIVNAALKKPLDVDDRMKERHYGVFEGRATAEFRDWQQAALKAGALPEENGYPCPEGAEPYAVFKARVTAGMRECLDAFPEENIMFVAHGGVYRVLRRLLTDCADHSPNARPFEFCKGEAAWELKEI